MIRFKAKRLLKRMVGLTRGYLDSRISDAVTTVEVVDEDTDNHRLLMVASPSEERYRRDPHATSAFAVVLLDQVMKCRDTREATSLSFDTVVLLVDLWRKGPPAEVPA